MKNLRKVVALVLAFAMVLSMSAVTFAAEMSAAEKAETLGILLGEGDGVTADYLAKAPTRLQAAIISLRLRGLEDEALAFEGTENFADASDIPWAGGQAITAYLYANPELGWIGDGTNFMPNEPITAQQYVKVMLESLGYAQGTEFAWEEVFAYATSVGLDDLSEGTVMTNNQLAVGMVEALSATTSTGETLLDKLIAAGAITEAKAIAAGLVEEEVDFALKSVEAFGLKSIKVTFTSDIDDDEDYDVVVEDDDYDVESYTITDNVMIVTLVDVMEQSKELDLEISAIGVDGLEVDEEAATVVMKDKQDPELVSVVVENAKTIVVTFSEPINPEELTDDEGYAVFDDVLIDDAKLVGELEISDDYTEFTYTLNDALAANTYVFSMEENIVDFAGFVADDEEVTITVIADDAEPQIVEVEVNSTTEIVLVFDEDVYAIGEVTVGGNEVSEDNVDVDESEEVTITLDAADETILGTTDAFVSVEVTWEDIEDAIGNTGDGETTFKATFDDNAPTAEVSVTSDNYIVITFSEEVYPSSDALEDDEDVTVMDLLLDGITVTNDDDDEIDVDAVYELEGDYSDDFDYDDAEDDDDATIYLIALDVMDLDEVDYEINIDAEDIVDGSVFENVFSEADYDVTMEDTLAPTIVGNVVTLIDTDDYEQTIRITFSEEMDEDTLEDDGNYIFDGQPLDEYDYEIAVDDDLIYVDIIIDTEDEDFEAHVLAEGETADDYAIVGVEVELYGLEDAAGNAIEDHDFLVEAAAASFGADDVTLTLTDVDTIELDSADHSFTEADPDDFTFYYADGEEVTSRYITSAVVDEDDDTILILTINKDLKPDVTTDNVNMIYLGVASGDTIDTNEIPLVVAYDEDGTIVDDVSATADIDFDDDNIDGVSANDDMLIVVTYDEYVMADIDDVINSILVYNEDDSEYVDLEAADLTFYDVDLDEVDSDEGFIYMTFVLDPDVADEYTVEVLSRYIADGEGNVAGGIDEETFEPAE